MTDFLWTDQTERQKRLNNIPLHKEGDIKDIGHLAVYLCSAKQKTLAVTCPMMKNFLAFFGLGCILPCNGIFGYISKLFIFL